MDNLLTIEVTSRRIVLKGDLDGTDHAINALIDAIEIARLSAATTITVDASAMRIVPAGVEVWLSLMPCLRVPVAFLLREAGYSHCEKGLLLSTSRFSAELARLER